MPASLSRAFLHEREYPVIENEYPTGESQRSVLAGSSRRRWRLSKRLTAAQLQALRNFYDARKGPEEAFWFYDPYESVPRFSSDPTGASPFGRYAVRFSGRWEQSMQLGRIEVSIELVEVS